jgi:hypothetical protein
LMAAPVVSPHRRGLFAPSFLRLRSRRFGQLLPDLGQHGPAAAR